MPNLKREIAAPAGAVGGSPRSVSHVRWQSALALFFAAFAWTAGSRPARAQVVRQDFYVTNQGGSVNAAVLSGNTLYIGGEFEYVGPATGGGVPLDLASGAPTGVYSRVTGTVSAVVPDGAGGWYLGGVFSAVGGSPRSNIAHVLADGTVSAWDPSAAGG